MKQEHWQDEWPEEPGWYWFYGERFRNSEPELCFVEVVKVSNGLMYITRGHCLYKEEGCKGKWQKAILPELPEEAR